MELIIIPIAWFTILWMLNFIFMRCECGHNKEAHSWAYGDEKLSADECYACDCKKFEEVGK